jgi:hypothetical protein
MNHEEILHCLPYAAVAEEVHAKTPQFLAICRQLAKGRRLYGFILGADEDVTSLNVRGNTEEDLRESADEWVKKLSKSKHAARVPAEYLEPDKVMQLQRFEPSYWRIDDQRLSAKDRRQLPGKEINKLWKKFQSAVDEDHEDYFELAEAVQERLLDAIVDGLAQFDREYDWTGIDRSQFLLSIFIWDGPPELNLSAAKRLNTPEIYNAFQRCYAPSSLEGQ